jgi:hypothetical protein
MICSCGLAFASQDAPPPHERSGEPSLRKLLEHCGAIRDLHVEIIVSSRETKGRPFYPSRQLELIYASPTNFRVTLSTMWGDAAEYRCSGTALLRDPMDDSAAATLTDAENAIHQCHADLGANGQAGAAFYYFLAGAKSFEQLVALESGIRQLPKQGGLEGLEFGSKLFGKMRVFYSSTRGRLTVRRIEYDNMEHRREEAKKNPEWVEPPQDPLDVEDIVYVSMGKQAPSSNFDTAPRPGLKVEDKRKKPPSGRLVS